MPGSTKVRGRPTPRGGDDLEPGLHRARTGHTARPVENDDPMQDTDEPPRRKDADDAETASAEARMRLALERLGTRSSPAEGGSGARGSGAAMTARGAPRPRKRFVRDGDVPVEHVPSPARLSGDAGRELTEERAARQRAEQALADAQGTIGRLQSARSRAEQAAQSAQAAVEEREAALAALRAELRRAGEREAALIEAARVEAEAKQAEVKLKQAPATGPEPVRWWLEHVRTPRS